MPLIELRPPCIINKQTIRIKTCIHVLLLLLLLLLFLLSSSTSLSLLTLHALIKCHSVYLVASEEFARLMKYWEGKQQEMESNFKQLYNPGIPTTKQRKGKNCKRVVHSNKELSSYAGSLTKEFFVEVRTSKLLSCIS